MKRVFLSLARRLRRTVFLFDNAIGWVAGRELARASVGTTRAPLPLCDSKTNNRRSRRCFALAWFVVVASLLSGHTSVRAASLAHEPLLPWPRDIQVADGRFVLRDGLAIVVATSSPARVREIAELLSDGLRSS